MKKYYAQLKKCYNTYYGHNAESIIPLAPTASNRQYFRLSSATDQCIAVYNPNRPENEAFVYIARQLKNNGVPVPEVYFTNLNEHIYLQQDLGNTMLYNIVEDSRNNKNISYLNYYKKVIELMPVMQVQSAKNFNFSKCFPRSEFDEQSIMWDLNYFKYYFLKLAYIPFHEQELENDFKKLTHFLLKASSDYFLFRDLQSRNIMVQNDDIFFIDFQGGRKGALQYDLASLLFEAKACLTPNERDTLLKYYLQVFSNNVPSFNKDKFLKYFPAFVLIRLLQAFGAYGYRGYFERKSLFLQSIAPALDNMNQVLTNMPLGVDIPHLTKALQVMVSKKKEFSVPKNTSGKLTVQITSFSFKKGIPQDYSGNGGGYVFDCRALPNPGRIDAYRDKNGKDHEVIAFLKPLPEVQEFLSHIYAITSNSVETYINRNFEHLMINIGCTGGQHRSVYIAECLARYLSENFDANIQVYHREQER